MAPDLEASASLTADAELAGPSPSEAPTLAARGSTIVVAGLSIATPAGSDLHYVQRYVGERNVANDIKRLRRYSLEMMRRMGTPVIVKHMWNDRDRKEGIAEESPIFNNAYGATRGGDQISHGVGFVSVEKSTNEWIASNGEIVSEDPGGNAPFAPKYRGYGPGYVTWIIEPDAAMDFYKHTPEGVFIRVQEAKAQAPWWPAINDNDLVVQVELDNEGFVAGSHERYQAKMTNPVSIRGTDRRGRQEYGSDLGNRRVINQVFDLALLPDNTHPAFEVEIDR